MKGFLINCALILGTMGLCNMLLFPWVGLLASVSTEIASVQVWLWEGIIVLSGAVAVYIVWPLYEPTLHPGWKAILWSVPLSLAISAALEGTCWLFDYENKWLTSGHGGIIYWLLYQHFKKQTGQNHSSPKYSPE
jgi:hypothetical protein